ncbi:hypothetical protein [Blautia faecis]|uniref:hypothetical protein n=1 Tax=Blautia faecis TaxID=871665 RepID=UPI001D06FF65|nr:hypothetical protein [Blautia faecis]MCB6579524.1 hypothetical protein [Blautia faecis]MCB7291492.1 hypothetical protein [Blautia faecis]
MERTIKLDEASYGYLIQMLQERYYSTVDVEELRKINEIYKALGCKSETWLSMMEPKKNQKENK